jgi:hypothetical protein
VIVKKKKKKKESENLHFSLAEKHWLCPGVMEKTVFWSGPRLEKSSLTACPQWPLHLHLSQRGAQPSPRCSLHLEKSRWVGIPSDTDVDSMQRNNFVKCYL